LPLPLAIDHAVIAVRDLDAAAARFSQLGFTLTPRGHHSIGSQNHCIMLASTYLELLAAPVAHPWLDYYRAFLEHAEGFAALALSTDDADGSYRQLKERGIAARPPMDLARPVDGGVARFRLVQIENLPQMFICQHLTRDLVWRREWQRHANGATELVRPTQWTAGSALAVKGLRMPIEAHGVRLEPA
jgi:hypothetical protein